MYGYAQDISGNLKPILLDNIRNISYINNENIYIEYIGATSQAEGNILITLSTNTTQIQPAVENWIKHNTSGSGGTKKSLNQYLGPVDVLQVLNAGSNSTTVTYQTAGDLATACAILAPSETGYLNVGAAWGKPTIGAILFVDAAFTDVVADGTYKVIGGGDFFVTITSGVISAVEICPVNIDAWFGPNDWDAKLNGMMSYTGCFIASMGGASATSQWMNSKAAQPYLGIAGLSRTNTTVPNATCPRNALGGATLYYSNVDENGPWYKWYSWNSGSPAPLGTTSGMSTPVNGSSMSTNNISIPAFQVSDGGVDYTYPRASDMSGSNTYFCGGTFSLYSDSATGANNAKLVDTNTWAGCGVATQNTCVFPCP